MKHIAPVRLQVCALISIINKVYTNGHQIQIKEAKPPFRVDTNILTSLVLSGWELAAQNVGSKTDALDTHVNWIDEQKYVVSRPAVPLQILDLALSCLLNNHYIYHSIPILLITPPTLRAIWCTRWTHGKIDNIEYKLFTLQIWGSAICLWP